MVIRVDLLVSSAKDGVRRQPLDRKTLQRYPAGGLLFERTTYRLSASSADKQRDPEGLCFPSGIDLG